MKVLTDVNLDLVLNRVMNTIITNHYPLNHLHIFRFRALYDNDHYHIRPDYATAQRAAQDHNCHNYYYHHQNFAILIDL